MIAFQVQLNRKKICTAGFTGGGVLSAVLHWAGGNSPGAGPEKDHLSIRVGGLMNATDEHVRWAERDLKAGDEVRIKILDVAKADKPSERDRKSAAETTKRQKRQVRRMAKSFGWQIRS